MCRFLPALALLAFAPLAQANPPCAAFITSDITLTGDLDCSGTGTSAALYIAEPGVVVDGAGHTITSDGAAAIQVRPGATGATLRDVRVVHATTYISSITIDTLADGVVLDQVELEVPGGSPVSRAVLSRGDGITVRDSRITSPDARGIEVHGIGATLERVEVLDSVRAVVVRYSAGDVAILDSTLRSSREGLYSSQQQGYLRVHDSVFEAGEFAIQVYGTSVPYLPLTLDFARNDLTASSSGIDLGAVDGQGQVLDLSDTDFGVKDRALRVLGNDLTFTGIEAQGGREVGVELAGRNLEVTGATLRGFHVGIQLYGTDPSAGLLVDDALVCGSTYGVRARAVITTVPGPATVRDSVIANSTFAVWAEGDWLDLEFEDVLFDNVSHVLTDQTTAGVALVAPSYSSAGTCARGFDHAGAVSSLQALIQGMIADTQASGVPGGNGMIAKLNQILAEVQDAFADWQAGTITTADYVQALQAALSKLDAFDQQLAAKIGNGQITAPTSTDLTTDSAAVRQILLDLIANA